MALSGVNKSETSIFLWSLSYVICIFIAYYLLRPVRDTLGLDAGISNLPWLFSGTLLAMLIVSPLFSWAVKRWTRIIFISISYRFFAGHLLVFSLLQLPFFSGIRAITGIAFFIWVSVFNLFVVSVFWSFVVDVFSADRGRRLFGFLAAGATVGGMAGSVLTLLAVDHAGPAGLMLMAVVMLEAGVRSARQAAAGITADTRGQDAGASPVGGTIFAGITHTFKSPYLAGIALFMVLYSVTSTFLYMEQAAIAARSFTDREARTAFFAGVDLWVNVFTLLAQVFLTSGVIRWLGVTVTLAILPAVTLTGFTLLLAAPSLMLFILFQVVRRVTNFAFARPGREILFTAVTAEDRYKSKNFIDTVIYRFGDQIGSWSYGGASLAGSNFAALAFIAIPVSVLWLGLTLWLGRRHKQFEISSRQSL
ncbi:MFS transporter [Pantoea sp. B9002]|nr:MFS transporter [Pantoea sp. B9002]NWA63199.1 MFS transporter [Pantoea sp. B9002]